MKRKILFFCNTHFQLMVAIDIKMTRYKDYDADIIISDYCDEINNILCNLRELKLFRKIFRIDIWEATNKSNSWLNILDIITVNFLQQSRYRNIDFTFLDEYDCLLYYNCALPVWVILDRCKEKNNKIKIERFEEGILQYGQSFDNGYRIRITHLLRKKLKKIINKSDLMLDTKDFYCYAPTIYNKLDNSPVKYNPIQIKNCCEKKDIINKIFGYCGQTNIPQKYVYLCTLFDDSREEQEEINLIKKLATVLGKENLIIKIHPRCKSKMYYTCGIQIMGESRLPWEIVQENLDDNCKILTLCSSAALNAAILYESDRDIYYLYPFIKTHSPILTKQIESISRIIELLKNPHYKVISSFEQLRS